MARGPMVSVVMSAYNAKGYVAAALESALPQTHKNVEIVVMDDALTDGTARVEERYCPHCDITDNAALSIILRTLRHGWVNTLDESGD